MNSEALEILHCAKHSSLKSFDFTTLKTTIPHRHLNSRFNDLTNDAFATKTDRRHYEDIAVNYNNCYFADSDNSKRQLYTESEIRSMVDFWVDNM